MGCDVVYLMSSRMAFSDCSTSRALAGCSGPLYPPSRSRIHPAVGRPTANAAAPASNGGLDVTCMWEIILVNHVQCYLLVFDMQRSFAVETNSLHTSGVTPKNMRQCNSNPGGPQRDSYDLWSDLLKNTKAVPCSLAGWVKAAVHALRWLHSVIPNRVEHL